MKKILLLALYSLGAQAIYFYFFMFSEFNQGIYSYNLVSIVSVVMFMLIYMKKTVKTLFIYGFLNFIQNVFIAIVIPVMLLVLVFYLSVSGHTISAMIYHTVYSDLANTTYSSLVVKVWEYHLLNLNFVVMMLNLFVCVIDSKDDDVFRNFKLTHKSITFGLLITVLMLIILDLPLFYFLLYALIGYFIVWISVPVMFALCREFKLYTGVLVGWTIYVLLMWRVIDIIGYIDRAIYIFEGTLF